MTSQSIRIVAVGDLSFNGPYSRLLRRLGPAHPFRFVLPAWREADLRLGNLESPITAAPRGCASKLALRAAPGAAEALRAAGFDCLTLANNHMMDYGPLGLFDTRAALDAAGIAHVGAGRDAPAASEAAVLRRRGQTVGVLGFCDVRQRSPLYAGPSAPGVAAFEIGQAVRAIRELRPRVDWLVVQIHWGVEMSRLPAPRQREWACRMAAAGADLILGHHPHVLQPAETAAGAPVLYSLGNFLFSDMFWRGQGADGAAFVGKLRLHPLSRRTAWAEVVLTRGRPPSLRLHPVRLGRDLAVRPTSAESRRRDWDAICSALTAENYDETAEREERRAAARNEWAAAWQTFGRRLELKLFESGLLPFAAVGD
jgi:hypothetical protein